jgi:hypothetical protein
VRVTNWVPSSARNFTFSLPACSGMPVINPDCGFKVRPSGSGSGLVGSTLNVTVPSALTTMSCPLKTGAVRGERREVVVQEPEGPVQVGADLC